MGLRECDVRQIAALPMLDFLCAEASFIGHRTDNLGGGGVRLQYSVRTLCGNVFRRASQRWVAYNLKLPDRLILCGDVL